MFNEDADEEIQNHQMQGTLLYLDIYLNTETAEQSRQRLADQNQIILNDLAETGDKNAPPRYGNPYTSEYLRLTLTLLIA